MVEGAVLGVEGFEGGGTGQGYEGLMNGLGAEELAGGTGGEGEGMESFLRRVVKEEGQICILRG